MVSVTLRSLCVEDRLVLTMGLIASIMRLGIGSFTARFAAESLAVSPPLIGLVFGTYSAPLASG